MEINKDTYYLVLAKVLPEVFLKTLKAKEILRKGEATTIQEAVEIVGMSRSAYYKYKDAIMPFNEISKGKIITIALLLEHTPGVLSKILNQIAEVKGSILTMNQNIPLHGMANVTISFETKDMLVEIEGLIQLLEDLEGVKEINIVGKE
ncbi:ACT domain-containing protein [Alkaliphilus peptidifermentans]|uniref:UPF0735 ACT domain-containing protein SAMN03080606_01457 n=1 Tax=Alkaliphilus peptidifermentans DSM 18978 TaxID=1120976 RepID=A0A1G5FLK1_9FIRM|nr:ACT domain-containing protein [Alkaliphilus peptidifermentans]SCY40024.1 chorismate mutase [Alkaliphilus peptidifermentans DSM 18978]